MSSIASKELLKVSQAQSEQIAGLLKLLETQIQQKTQTGATPKLEAPDTFTGEKGYEDYKLWTSKLAGWEKLYPTCVGDTKAQMLRKALKGKAYQLVNDTCSADASFADIMEKLSGFALDQILSEYQDFVKFDTCKRHGRHMVDFLLDYCSKLELAEKAGITFSNRLKSYHLLDRADLNANMRTSVMQQMQAETEAGKKAEGADFEVKYESVVAKLRTIGNAKDMQDIVKGGAQTKERTGLLKQKDKEIAALKASISGEEESWGEELWAANTKGWSKGKGTPKGKGKGKGKGKAAKGLGKGQGLSAQQCRKCGKLGHWGNECGKSPEPAREQEKQAGQKRGADEAAEGVAKRTRSKP